MKINYGKLLQFLVLSLLFAVSFSLTHPHKQTVSARPDTTYIKVVGSGTDTQDCGSESNPCQTIQFAVNQSNSGDVIQVAAGAYKYHSDTDKCSFLTTNAVVCFVDKHLTILGGYSTNNWSKFDPSSNPTIIDGENSSRGVSIIAYNSTASLRMEGFTIQNGLAQGASSGDDFYINAFGGGMWAQNSNVTLRDMVFKNNKSRGGNTASQYGGGGSGAGLAIQSTKGGVVSVLERVTFDENQAFGGTGTYRGGVSLGGALFTYKSALNGTDLTFTNNKAQAGNSNGSGKDNIHGLHADALGGGAAFQTGSSVTLTRITAQSNQVIGGDAGSSSGAEGGGGFGGAISAEEANITITEATLRGNSANGGSAASGGVAFGGAILTDNTDADLDRVNIIDNAAISGASKSGGDAGAPSGGGAYITAFTPTRRYQANIINSIIAGNRMQVGSPGNSVGGGGAGIVIQAMDANIIHSTVAGNRFIGYLKAGQAIQVHGLYGSSGAPAIATIKYTIIANHVNPDTTDTSALTVTEGSSVNLHQGLFAGNTNDINTNNKPFSPGTITGLSSMYFENSVDFVSPNAPDYDFHLTNSSVAIDLASDSDTAIDMDGDPRPSSVHADIGADEYTGLVLPGSIHALTDNDTPATRTVRIIYPTQSPIEWTATANANWLYLGAQGTSQRTTGYNGEYLVIRFIPTNVGLGTFDTTIDLTAPGYDPASMEVRIIKVAHLEMTYLPFTLHR